MAVLSKSHKSYSSLSDNDKTKILELISIGILQKDIASRFDVNEEAIKKVKKEKQK